MEHRFAQLADTVVDVAAVANAKLLALIPMRMIFANVNLVAMVGTSPGIVGIGVFVTCGQGTSRKD